MLKLIKTDSTRAYL